MHGFWEVHAMLCILKFREWRRYENEDIRHQISMYVRCRKKGLFPAVTQLQTYGGL